MRKTIILLTAICAATSVGAQSGIERVLASVEQNNTMLKTLREEGKAQKLGNRTDIYLENPEAGFNLLWGSPSSMGTRKDFSISQTFNLATLTGVKRRMADKQDALVDIQYTIDRQTLLLEAKQCCIDLVYYNAMSNELKKRYDNALKAAEAYKKMFNTGSSNIIDYNKAQVNLAAVRGEMSRIDVERQVLLNTLKQLNGGTEIAFSDTEYDKTPLPASFDEWYAGAERNNPALAYAKQQTEVSRHEVKLNKAMGLPDISAGYMSESTPGETFRGITLGVSIPLWANKNKVKQAKAGVAAAEMKQRESKQYLYNTLQNLYLRAKGLKLTAAGYRETLSTLNSTDLLVKAFNIGEMSLLNFITELELYYDATDQAMQAERDFEKAKAELFAAEL